MSAKGKQPPHVSCVVLMLLWSARQARTSERTCMLWRADINFTAPTEVQRAAIPVLLVRPIFVPKMWSPLVSLRHCWRTACAASCTLEQTVR